MPRVSAFYGIVIAMYYREPTHAGRPHFHAEYAEAEATIDVITGEVLAGALPSRALRLVREWSSIHRAELMSNWRRARRGLPLSEIDPL